MNAITLSKTPLRQVTDVKSLLMNEQAKGQLAAVSAKHMNPERMMRVVANAIRTTPMLQQCEPLSFLGALMQCASLGLEPNTILGHAYLIPFKNNRKGVVEVQLIVGYKGLIDLARRSGHITSLSANIHYSDDDLWEYEEGTEAKLRHRPGAMAGQKLHSYAIAKFKDGGHAYVVLPWAHVMKIRDGSQGYQTAVKYGKKDSPWIAHEDEMAKKTAIRALAKYLPLSVEFADAMTVDEARADYRTFALDPSAGIADMSDEGDGEVDAIEHVADESKPAAQAEKKPSRAEAQKEFRKEQAAQIKPEAKKSEPAQEKPAPQSDQPGEDIAGEGEETIPAHTEQHDDEVDLMTNAQTRPIIQDALDLGSDASRAANAETIERIRDDNPGLFSALDDELNRIDG